MTVAEAKEKRRWWNQNGYKFKGEEMPAEVVQALKLLGDPIPTTLPIKTIPPDPEMIVPQQTTAFTERDGFGHQSIEWVKASELPAVAEVPQPIGTMPTHKPKGGYKGPVVQDEFTEQLTQLSQERMTATPERAEEIDAERQSIYSKRTARKKAKSVVGTTKIKQANPTRIPQLPTVSAIIKPTKPAPKMRKLSEASPQESTEIKQLVAEIATPASPPPITKPSGSEFHLMLALFAEISTELARGESLHEWPEDVIHQAAVVGEESGELLRAALLWRYEGGSVENIRKETIHTAATCLRLLKNLPQ